MVQKIQNNVVTVVERAKSELATRESELKFRRTFEGLYDDVMLEGFEFVGVEKFQKEVGGAFVSNLLTAFKKNPYAERYFSKIVPVDFDKASLLHYANLKSGTFVFVPKGVAVDEVLKVSGGHVLVVAEEDSSVVIAEENLSDLACVEIYVGRGAKVDYVGASLGKSVIHTKRSHVENGAEMKWWLANFGGAVSYQTVQSHVIGEFASSDIVWAFMTRDNEKMDFFAGNIFDARNAKGQILSKAVGADKSKSAFVGEIDITLQGAGTDSYLKEDVLMLDSTCKVDAIPSLEIKTNDVKAGHGVSISRITDEHLFYLMSKGISKELARELVLDGFLKSLYSDFPVSEIVSKIEAYA